MVFTSSAFNQWAASHVNKDSTSAFNPYLTGLFYALYVLFAFEISCQEFSMLFVVPACQLSASSVPHYTLSYDYSDNDPLHRQSSDSLPIRHLYIVYAL